MFQSACSKATSLSSNGYGVVGWRTMLTRATVIAVSLLPGLRTYPCDAQSTPGSLQLAPATKDSSAMREAKNPATKVSPAALDAKKKPPEMSFAYANKDGTALLADTFDPILATHLDRAICDDGRIITTKFTGMQAVSKQSTNRHNAQNFDADRGARFAAVGGTASRVCLLVAQDFLEGKRVLPIGRPNPSADKRPCDSKLRERMPALGTTSLEQCRFITSIGTDTQLVAARYVISGDDPQLALVVLTKTGTFIDTGVGPTNGDSDVPAEDSDLNKQIISPMFAFARADGSVEIALDWPQDGSDVLSLFKTTPPDFLEEVFVGILYNAPL